jgi:HEAT repeat protein
MRPILSVILVLSVAAFPVACKRAPKPQEAAEVVSGLQSDRPADRARAAIEVTKLGDAAAAPLAEMLLHPDPKTRAAAANALWTLGPKAKPVLGKMIVALKDKNPDVRIAIAMTLEAIGPDASGAVGALTEALYDADWNVRQHAAKALGGIGAAAASAVPALERAAKDDYMRASANEAIGKIRAALSARAQAAPPAAPPAN